MPIHKDGRLDSSRLPPINELRSVRYSVSAVQVASGMRLMTEHITDERLFEFIIGRLELTDGEEEHLRDCQNCNDRFRTFLTSDVNAKAS